MALRATKSFFFGSLSIVEEQTNNLLNAEFMVFVKEL